MFAALSVELDEDDEEGSIVDATIVRAHLDAAGKKGIERNALGHSRGGFSTKIHAIVTTKGRPLHVQLTQGQRHESTVARDLLEHARGKYLLADAGDDSNSFVDAVREVGLRPVICSGGEAACAETRQKGLLNALPGRVLLSQTEALSRHRRPLREDSSELPLTRSVRLFDGRLAPS